MADVQPMTVLLRPEDSIFVAGHRGMAGSSIVRCLQKRGYENIFTVSRQDVDLVDADAVS